MCVRFVVTPFITGYVRLPIYVRVLETHSMEGFEILVAYRPNLYFLDSSVAI